MDLEHASLNDVRAPFSPVLPSWEISAHGSLIVGHFSRFCREGQPHDTAAACSFSLLCKALLTGCCPSFLEATAVRVTLTSMNLDFRDRFTRQWINL